MALTSTLSGSSVVYEERIIGHHTRTYNWPPLQLNFWIFVMLLASTSIVGVFSIFIQQQEQLGLLIPWYVGIASLCATVVCTNAAGNRYFPYYITVGCLVILYVVGIIWLIANRRLLPAIVMIGSFMMLVMWMVGLVAASVELWGPTGTVQSNCNLQVFSQNTMGSTVQTLAWLQQKSICKL